MAHFYEENIRQIKDIMLFFIKLLNLEDVLHGSKRLIK